MRTITQTVYKIDEHPDKEKCFDWIRDNWHDLNQHSVNEVVDSLKALVLRIGGSLDYSISSVADRGEFIKLVDYDKEHLSLLNAEDCPLTGVCWDMDIIQGLREGEPERVLETLHKDTEYQYSDEGLLDMCQANEYEFHEDGRVC